MLEVPGSQLSAKGVRDTVGRHFRSVAVKQNELANARRWSGSMYKLLNPAGAEAVTVDSITSPRFSLVNGRLSNGGNGGGDL